MVTLVVAFFLSLSQIALGTPAAPAKAKITVAQAQAPAKAADIQMEKVAPAPVVPDSVATTPVPAESFPEPEWREEVFMSWGWFFWVCVWVLGLMFMLRATGELLTRFGKKEAANPFMKATWYLGWFLGLFGFGAPMKVIEDKAAKLPKKG